MPEARKMKVSTSRLYRHHMLALSSVGFTLFASPQLLLAQVPGATTLEEIVVTARQREERLIDVPATVTVFSETEIENAAISRPSEFIMRTPGLSQVQTLEVGDMQVSVRGINSGRDTESSVALVIDGVLLTNPNALNQELDDMVQIEVLKGPQGAIYGRNALAGAIILTTAKPPREFEADVSATAGNFNLKKGHVGVGGPLGENAETKFRMYYRKDDGSFKNSFRDCDDCMNFMDEVGGVARLTFRPTDSTEMDFKARYSDIEAGSLAFNASLALKDAAAAGFGDLFYEDANDHDFIHLNRNNPDNQQSTVNFSMKSVTEFEDAGSLTFTASYNDAENYFLGAGTSNAFGIYNGNALCQQEYEASKFVVPVPAPFFWAPNIANSFLPPYPPISCGGYQYQQRDQKDSAVEIRFESPQDQSLRWMTGAYYADIDRHLVVSYGGDLGLGQYNKGYVTADGPNPTDLLYDDDLLSKVYAIFGNVEYDVTDTVEVALALRYDTEDREVDNNVPKVGPGTPGFGAFGSPVCPNGPTNCSYFINPFYNVNPTLPEIPSRKSQFSQLQPKLTVNWQPSDEYTVFASYGVGFRSGGFNSSGTTATLQQFFGNLALADGTSNLNDLRDDFDKELSRAFEIGFKSRLLSNTLQLNGAIYYTETEDMQDFSFFAGPFGSLRVVTNIDEAEIQGIELDAKWLLNQYFSVYAGVGLVDTEIKDYSTRPYTTGNKLPYIPDYTASLGAEFNTDLGSSGWELNARVDTMFVGETWFSPVQDNYVPNFFTAFGFGGGEFSRQKRDAYSTTDLTISLTDGSWSVQAWGKNVFDKNYLEEVIPAPEFGGSFIHETFGRTYGLTVSKNFGGE